MPSTPAAYKKHPEQNPPRGRGQYDRTYVVRDTLWNVTLGLPTSWLKAITKTDKLNQFVEGGGRYVVERVLRTPKS